MWAAAAAGGDDNDDGSFLYTLSLYTGLLGGAVYVHGYTRITADYDTDSSMS